MSEASITFRYAEDAAPPPSRPLLVHVLDHSLEFVAQTVTGRPVPLPADRLLVAGAVLPDGRRLQTVFHTPEQPGDMEVVLRAGTPAPAPRWNSPIGHRRAAAPSSDEMLFGATGARRRRPARTTCTVRLVEGNLLKSRSKITVPEDWNAWPEDWTLAPQGPSTRFAVRGTDTTRYLQIIQPDREAINVVIPAAPGEEVRISLVQAENGAVVPDILLPNAVADTLLRSSANRQMENIRHVVEDPDTAESLLWEKIGSPIGAAVGGYALLRLGELDRMHDWAANLLGWFPWLPDGVTIRAEQCARLGQHAEALDLLLRLPGRGLPMFSSGLAYAANRTRAYLQAAREWYVHPSKLAALHRLDRQLQRFVAFVDFSRPILTFTGSAPLRLRAGTNEGRSTIAKLGKSVRLPPSSP
ncbi:hypothetical protein ABMY26_08955 [Azospirillum sp. HJ39]|uniref:hypothetical protein n=1 Tax=Azospirillum sp. HJ39 TaxID=3159496 RepID=UPI003556B091